jgi:hypothetical protein
MCTTVIASGAAGSLGTTWRRQQLIPIQLRFRRCRPLRGTRRYLESSTGFAQFADHRCSGEPLCIPRSYRSVLEPSTSQAVCTQPTLGMSLSTPTTTNHKPASLTTNMRAEGLQRSSWANPLRGLAGYRGDPVIVLVVMENCQVK